MLGILILLLRYLFLALFYVFLIKLTLAIFNDLRRNNQKFNHDAKCDVKSIQAEPDCGGDGAGLVVLTAAAEDISAGSVIPLGNNTVIGRVPGCQIKIIDNFISSKHAVIKYRDNQYWVEDLGSLNGTYLNEIKLKKPAVLANGDILRVGGVSFEFVRWAYEVEPNN